MSSSVTLRKEVTGIILFFTAIAITLMYYLPADVVGPFGSFLKMLGFGLIGQAAFIFPLFLFVSSIDFFFEKRDDVTSKRIKCVLLLMIGVSSLFAVCSMDFDYFKTLCMNSEGKATATAAISLLWKSGENASLIRNPSVDGAFLTGGIVGGGIATALELLVGRVISILGIIVFLIAQIVLIFRISLKATAKKTQKAIAGKISQKKAATQRPGNYRYAQSQSAGSITAVPRQNQASSGSPFVYAPTNIGNVSLYEKRDPFNTKLPADRKSGFVDTEKSFGMKAVSAQEGQLSYGNRTVRTDNVPVDSTQYDFNAYAKNPPIIEKPEDKELSFLTTKPRPNAMDDFYNLDDTQTSSVPVPEKAAEDYSDVDMPYEIEDDDEEYYDYSDERTSARWIRKPNVSESWLKPSSQVPAAGRQPDIKQQVDSVVTPQTVVEKVFEENHISSEPVSVSERKPDKAEAIDKIKINSEAEETEGYSRAEGRKIDTDTVASKPVQPVVPEIDYSRGKYNYSKSISLLLSKVQKDPPKLSVNEEPVLKEKAKQLIAALESFGINAEVSAITHGPAITRFEVKIATGTKVSRVTGLSDDLMLAMAAVSIRIEAPIPGKSAIGIEIPNDKTTAVHLGDMICTKKFQESSPLNVALGRNIPGDPIYCDLSKMPHLLIAGSTGSGKSVCINSILMSILCHSNPNDVKLIMVDPKVVELQPYNGIPHLLLPVVTDPKKASASLKWAVSEMEKRYKEFAYTQVRDIKGYNQYVLNHPEEGKSKMPLVLIIIDELADLMTVAGKEVEISISRLAAMARAAGMHMIIATQRPSVDVITGTIKSNIPSRIAFAVSNGVDSRTILDSYGAEKLLGKGDMLYAPQGASVPTRGQGAFVTDQEVEEVTNFLKRTYPTKYDEEVMRQIDSVAQGGSEVSSGGAGASSGSDDSDNEFEALVERAMDTLLDAGTASTSILQRRLSLGYPKASRIIDTLQQRNLVGPFEGSKPRKILVSRSEWEELKANK